MNNFYVRPQNEETFSVTIIDHHNPQTRSEYEEGVDFITLNLMLQADHVTLGGKTIEKKFTRVDGRGNVYFYGNGVEENNI